MGLNAIEAVASNQFPHQFGRSVAQSIRAFFAQSREGKVCLPTAIGRSVVIRHACVCIEVKAEAVGRFDACRSAEAVESIDDEHFPASSGGMVGGAVDTQRLGREALASGIDGRHTKDIVTIGGDGEGECGAPICEPAVVEIGVGRAGVDNVFDWCSGRFKGIGRGLPREMYLIFAFHQASRKVENGKRLHHRVLLSVGGADITEQALIDGSRHRKLEVGVVGIGHVAIVLMSQ